MKNPTKNKSYIEVTHVGKGSQKIILSVWFYFQI